MDHKRILGREQGIAAVAIEGCIPHDGTRLLDARIVGQGVGGAVGAALDQHVDGRRRHDQRRVVPAERYLVPDFVVR